LGIEGTAGTTVSCVSFLLAFFLSRTVLISPSLVLPLLSHSDCGIKASTQDELDRLVQFGNVTTENGAICPTKVKRKKPIGADVSMEDSADGYDEDNDEEGFDDDEEDEFEDDEDDLLPAHATNTSG